MKKCLAIRLLCYLPFVQLSKTYSHNDWREDLKAIVRNAGEAGKPTVFLFNDTQIKMESFLVDINNLLNSGEVSWKGV